jgi:YD repeat-containing protein
LHVAATYDDHGNPKSAKALDKDGNQILIKQGWGEVRLRHDRNGNTISTQFFDASSNRIINSGVHLIRTEYDDKGYARTVSLYDIEEHPTVNKDGFHKEVTLARDADGNPLQWAYFGVADERATDSDGVHEYKASYDSRGFRSSLAAFDREGRPTTIGKGGYHKIQQKYGPEGYKVWEVYFDREGRPTRDTDGSYQMKFTYDSRGNITEWVHLDADGRPTLTNDRYHRKTAEYNNFGKIKQEEFFGKNGEPVIVKDRYHKISFAYDEERGNITEISYFDQR